MYTHDLFNLQQEWERALYSDISFSNINILYIVLVVI